MSVQPAVEPQPSKIIIRGITQQGRKFRPSDWAERLCGAFATYGRGRRIHYHPLVQVGAWEGTNCVVVDASLEESEPMTFDFLMRFAQDNALQVVHSDRFPPRVASAK